MMQRDTTFSPQISPENPVNSDSKKQSLGKDANIVATKSKSGKFAAYKYLAHAQHFLIKHEIKSLRSGNIHRTRLCHAARAGNVDTISLNIASDPAAGDASLSGVQTCGSIWSCPVCARRIAAKRGHEVGYTIDKMMELGFMPILITTTARHHFETPLALFKDRFKVAWRYFTQSRRWRELKSELGIKHSIKAVEVTHGWENGWHYHQHGVLFVPVEFFAQDDTPVMEDWQHEVKLLWLQALAHAGLDGTYERAMNIKASGDIKKDYLTKLGLEQDTVKSVSHEISSGQNKDYKGRNIWHILRFASEGDGNYEDLYIEYVKAMSGTNWITYSRGLKDLVGLEDMPDEVLAESDEEPIEREALIEISDEEYIPVRGLRAYADLLKVATESRSKQVVMDWLQDLERQYMKTEFHRVRAKMLEQYQAIDEWLTRYRDSYNRRKANEEPSDEFKIKSRQWRELRRKLQIKN